MPVEQDNTSNKLKSNTYVSSNDVNIPLIQSERRLVTIYIYIYI